MFYFAKSLQAAAMGLTALALYVGFQENSMSKEISLLGGGVLIFLLGRLLEQYSRR